MTTHRSRTVLVIVALLFLFSFSFAPHTIVEGYNCTYSYLPLTSPKTGQTVPWVQSKTHNWILHQAYMFCKEHGLVPPGLNERYLHYGMSFADHPWTGRPETLGPGLPDGAHTETPGEPELLGRSVDKDKIDIALLEAGSLQVQYKNLTQDKPNMYLEAKWHFDFFDEERLEEFGADNLHHYGGSDKIRLDGEYKDLHAILFEYESSGPLVGPRVTAQLYGEKLYDLAVRFWPANSSTSAPNLLDLTPVPETGRLVGTLKKGSLNPTTDAAHSYLPPTFLGGNPYILTTHTESQGALATWPLWVPDEIQPGSQAIKQLTQLEAKRSSRTAAIYLGWALHMLTDLAQPYHTVNRTGVGHANFEDWADEHLTMPELASLPTVTTTLRRNIGLAKKGRLRWSLAEAADRIIPASRERYSMVRTKSSENNKKEVFRHLLDLAVTECVYAIATLGHQRLPEMETYELTIKTSGFPNAGTRAIPYVHLVGTEQARRLQLELEDESPVTAQSSWETLSKARFMPKGLFKFYGSGHRYYQTGSDKTRRAGTSDGNLAFSEGSRSTFRLRVPKIGTLRGVAIGHDNTGYSPGWAIDEIEVVDPKKIRWTWRRKSDKFWIARDSSDCLFVPEGISPEIRMNDIHVITPILPLANQGPATDNLANRRSLSPLKRFWSESREDNFATATQSGELTARRSDAKYRYVKTIANIPSRQSSRTVPLYRHWNESRDDNFCTTDREVAGYRRVQIEGYVFRKQSPGTIPLMQYWHADRGDNYTVCGVVDERRAVSSGYKPVRTLGYVYPSNIATQTPGEIAKTSPVGNSRESHPQQDDSPFGRDKIVKPKAQRVPLKSYWSASRTDNFAAASPEGHRAAATSSGRYKLVRTEGYVLSQRKSETIPLWRHWSEKRSDNFCTTEAVVSGYRRVQLEGFIFSARTPNTAPLRLYWHAGRRDNLVTATQSGERSANSAGYKLCKNVGLCLPFNRANHRFNPRRRCPSGNIRIEEGDKPTKSIPFAANASSEDLPEGHAQGLLELRAR